jgi:isopenicillin-N epimerase
MPVHFSCWRSRFALALCRQRSLPIGRVPAEKPVSPEQWKGNPMNRSTTTRRNLIRNVAACSLIPLTATVRGGRDALATSQAGAAAGNESHWNAIRSEFVFERGLAYFNNASLGSPPVPVLDAMSTGYRRLAANPTAVRTEFYAAVENRVRPAVARLLGADVSEITITRGASEGLHFIANGLDLQPGDEVVTTSQEHPGGLTPWLVRAEQSGVVVRQVPVPSPFASLEQPIEILTKALTSRTKVLFFCHVTRGGLLYPVKELCSIARNRGIVSAVDGAQAVGALHVDVRDLGCDLYATSLHKWTLAPCGNGAFFVRADTRPRFRSLFKTAEVDRAAAGYYDILGTYHFPVRVAAADALAFLERAGGVRAIEARNRSLSDYLKERLSGTPGVRLITPRSPAVSSPATTMFDIPGRKSTDVVRLLLERHRIHVDDHVRDGHDAIRVSTHFYNTRAEIDRLAELLRAPLNG